MQFFLAHLLRQKYLPHLFHQAHQYSHSARPTSQKSHTWKLIRPEREPKRGSFARPFGPEKTSLGWRLKKRKRSHASFAGAKIQNVGGDANAQ